MISVLPLQGEECDSLKNEMKFTSSAYMQLSPPLRVSPGGLAHHDLVKMVTQGGIDT